MLYYYYLKCYIIFAPIITEVEIQCLQCPADLVTFAAEILNGKLHFLCMESLGIVKYSYKFTNEFNILHFGEKCCVICFSDKSSILEIRTAEFRNKGAACFFHNLNQSKRKNTITPNHSKVIVSLVFIKCF